MKVIVTAPALVLMPGVVVRLSAAEALERRHCMFPLGNDLYRVTLENHFKKGQVVEFDGDIPKQFVNSCEAVGDDGRAIREAEPAAPAKSAQKTPTTISGPQASSVHEPERDDVDGMSEEERGELGSMTKAELIDFAEAHQVEIANDMNKAAIIKAIRKKVKVAA